MPHSEYDLIVHAGRVFCAATGLNGPGAVAVRGDRIVGSGPDVTGTAETRLDYPDGLLTPGLVDLHAHPGNREFSKFGVDPDRHFLTRGVTTVLSQGDAGAANWPDYRRQVIETSRTRVRMAINLSSRGESRPHGCFEMLADADVDACISAIRDGGDAIWGIAVNVSVHACGDTDPQEMLRRALLVAEETGLPLLFGSRRGKPDWPLADQLALLRAGDVFTYCFNDDVENLLDDHRHIKRAVWDARRRGVLFDVGHGMGSFVFEVAEAAIAEGFLPDTISTDQYARHAGSQPHHDLPRTLSKLIAAGMSEADAFARVTFRPAKILGLAEEAGTLRPGACADLAVLRFSESAADLCDIHGSWRAGGCWEPVLTVRGGQVVGTQ